MAKRGRRGVNPIYMVIICSLALVLITVVVVLLLGYRYTSENGIKFLGKVKDGQPLVGSLNYPGDNDGDLDKANNTIYFDNGDVYTGDIDYLTRDGYGIMVYANGDRYEGEWENDVINGEGKFYYTNGDEYIGQFKNGVPHGNGVVKLNDGDIYAGDYKDGMYHGEGIYTWANGDVYDGEYVNGAKEGYGELTLISGEKYKGNWKSDKREGAGGELFYQNGDQYFGPFINNLPDTRARNEDGSLAVLENGKYRHDTYGMYFYADGRSYTGYFEEGKIVTVDGDLIENTTPEYMVPQESSEAQ